MEMPANIGTERMVFSNNGIQSTQDHCTQQWRCIAASKCTNTDDAETEYYEKGIGHKGAHTT